LIVGNSATVGTFQNHPTLNSLPSVTKNNHSKMRAKKRGHDEICGFQGGENLD
jgi:hypothetical protein